MALVRIRSLQAFRDAGGAFFESGAWFLVTVDQALKLREAGHPLAEEVDLGTAEPPTVAEAALLQTAFAPPAIVDDVAPPAEESNPVAVEG